MAQDSFRSLLANKPNSLSQAADSRYIMGSRLAGIRQKIRHFKELRLASRAALQKGFGQFGAEQHPGSLGTVKPLVARHGKKSRSQFPQGDGQGTC